MNQEIQPDIGWSIIFKITIAVISIYILYLLKDIIVLLIFGLIIGVLFNFVIDALEKKRIPRMLATTVVYLGVFSIFSFFIYKTAPIFFSQIEQFVKSIPTYFEKVSAIFERFGLEAFRSRADFITTIQANLTKASENIFSALFSIFGGAFSTLFIIFLAFFVSLERNLIERTIAIFSPSQYQEYFNILWRKSKKKVSGWFISKVIGMVFVGVLTYIVLKIFNVQYAPMLGLFAGITDFIPIIGPAFAGIIISIIIAFNSPLQALFVLIAFFIIQLLENNFLLPIIFKKFTGLSPVLILVSLAVGAKLWGIWGAILVVPLAGILYEIFKDYLAKTRSGTSIDETITNETPSNL